MRKPKSSRFICGPSSGQAMIEYVLMMALLSTLTFGFVKFFTGVFERGLTDLPKKAGPCMSNAPSAGQSPCRNG